MSYYALETTNKRFFLIDQMVNKKIEVQLVLRISSISQINCEQKDEHKTKTGVARRRPNLVKNLFSISQIVNSKHKLT